MDNPIPLNPRDRACPICGKMEYVWGQIIIGKEPPHPPFYFRPYEAVWEDGDIPVYVRHCLICNNIQIFTSEF
jgi:hypothetical protein